MTPRSRHPPAVQYPLQRSAVLGALLVFWLLGSAMVLAAWVVLGARSAWAAGWVAAGLWLLALSGALHFWLGQFSGLIHWDGQAWALETSRPGAISWPLSGPPEVLLDMQTQLWLCVRPMERRRIWLWLERSSQPERWLDLRRAVYSRARPGTGNADAIAPGPS